MEEMEGNKNILNMNPGQHKDDLELQRTQKVGSSRKSKLRQPSERAEREARFARIRANK
jgi:hypothetical protein